MVWDMHCYMGCDMDCSTMGRDQAWLVAGRSNGLRSGLRHDEDTMGDTIRVTIHCSVVPASHSQSISQSVPAIHDMIHVLPVVLHLVARAPAPVRGMLITSSTPHRAPNPWPRSIAQSYPSCRKSMPAANPLPLPPRRVPIHGHTVHVHRAAPLGPRGARPALLRPAPVRGGVLVLPGGRQLRGVAQQRTCTIGKDCAWACGMDRGTMGRTEHGL
jgi:hypothetical protein